MNRFIHFYDFIVVALWFLGTIGGFGYAVYDDEYLISVAVLALGAMAAPYAYKRLKNTL